MIQVSKQWFHENKLFLAIIVLAFLVRFYFLSMALSMQGLEALTKVSADSVNYLKMANWLLGADIPYPEGRFFDWGIGHALWLAWILYLFKSPLAIFIVQIILSSLSCGLIYKLSIEMFDNKSIAIIASLLLVFSLTSINLSILILSDSLYFFLMLYSLYLFLIASKNNKWRYYIYGACLAGYAVLVRSIGQFWILFLFIILFVLLKNKFKNQKWLTIFRKHRGEFVKILVSLFIVFFLMSTWILHNYNEYKIPTLAFSSARGPANVCAYTEERLTGKPYRELQLSWIEKYKQENSIANVTYRQLYRLYQSNSKEYFLSHPLETIKTYLMISWENITNINMLHRATFPDVRSETYRLELLYNDSFLKYLNFIFSMLGLIILLLKRKFVAFTVLGIVYSYYFLMIGAIRWQGSRLFYPAQMASVILVSVFIYYMYDWVKKLYLHMLQSQK